MIFSVVIILIVGVVAYFHYVQGFFSATLSAFIAIIAAAIAISYHEPLSQKIVGGKFTDQATSLALLGIFVAVFVFCRVIFDKAVPGNIRLPVGFEKAGAGAMGLVAGIICAGMVAIAAQAMPFGISVAGYTRYATIDSEDMQANGGRSGQMLDETIHDVLKQDHLDPADASTMLLPVDDMVIGLVKKLSGGGALAGPQDFAQVHPNYLNELFDQRLGVQVGAHHVAFNNDKEKQVELKGIFTADSLVQGDGEIATMKGRWNTKLDPKVSSDANKILLIVRLSFARGASDADNNVRISTAAVRLVLNGKNYTPIGTLQMTDGVVLRAQRPDDFLILPAGGVGDFVFYLDRSDFGLTDPKAAQMNLPPDTFLEAKRLGFIDLSNQAISRTIPAQEGASFARKKQLPPATGSPAAGGSSAQPTATGPIDVGQIAASDQLFTDIALGTMPAEGAEATLRSGKATVKGGKFSKLDIEPTDSLTMIKQGESPVRTLFAPPGQKLYRVAASTSATNKWEWADKLGQFELVDADGTAYKPHGAATKVKAGITDKMIARYDADQTIDSLNGGGELRPTEIYLYFLVPDSRKPADLKFEGKTIKHVG